jgi:hypothetical protein
VETVSAASPRLSPSEAALALALAPRIRARAAWIGAGTTSIFTSSPLERSTCDAEVVTRHILL